MLVALTGGNGVAVAVNPDQVRYLKARTKSTCRVVFGKADAEHSIVVQGEINEVRAALNSGRS